MSIEKRFNKALGKETDYNTETKRWLNTDTGNWVKYIHNKQDTKAYNEANKDKIKEYNEINKDKISNRQKIYNEKNKVKIAEKHRVYYQNNKEVLSGKNKKNYEENKIDISIKQKIYNKKNKVKIAKHKKEYRLENKEEISAREKAFRVANIDKVRERDKIRYYKNRDETPLDKKPHQVYSYIFSKPGQQDLIYIGQTSHNINTRHIGHMSHKESVPSICLELGYTIKHHRTVSDNLERREALELESKLIKHHIYGKTKLCCVNIAQNEDIINKDHLTYIINQKQPNN